MQVAGQPSLPQLRPPSRQAVGRKQPPLWVATCLCGCHDRNRRFHQYSNGAAAWTRLSTSVEQERSRRVAIISTNIDSIAACRADTKSHCVWPSSSFSTARYGRCVAKVQIIWWLSRNGCMRTCTCPAACWVSYSTVFVSIVLVVVSSALLFGHELARSLLRARSRVQCSRDRD